MNKPRDPKGRYIRTSSHKPTNIPTNLYGGISTRRAQETLSEAHSGETIEKPEEPENRETLPVNSQENIEVEPQPEERSLEPLETPPITKPNDTTFSLVGDSNFVDIIDPEQVNILFRNSTNIVVSQIETLTLEPNIQ